MDLKVQAQKDFIENIATNKKPLDALCEIIWNGLDAGATKVEVIFERNDLSGLDCIKVIDNGCGINHSELPLLFGQLGNSWKKQQVRFQNRVLHGEKGTGRFYAFSLGANVSWQTIYQDNGHRLTYSIEGYSKSLDSFNVLNPTKTKLSSGTEVRISLLTRDFKVFDKDSSFIKIAQNFAAYLSEYPDVFIEYDGKKIDTKLVEKSSVHYKIEPIELEDGRRFPIDLSIIEWDFNASRVLHFCDSKGISLYSVNPKQRIQTPGYNFSAYIKSDYLRELNDSNLLILEEMSGDFKKIFKSAKDKIQSHFREKASKKYSEIVEHWKEEDIYPYEEKTDLGPIELAERQVFDILAVNIQSYLPEFEESDKKSKKFTFRLLAQAIKENPESVQTIISEVLELETEKQNELAELLQYTSLSSIISSAKIIANRLNFLNALEDLLFEKTNKAKLLERDQLHKILDSEIWLFSEDFSLSASEIKLEEVLNKHLYRLDDRADTIPVEVGERKTGRVDLMLSKANQPRAGEYDYLIIELKRPSKKIDDQVIMQIKGYANAVAKDERFHNIPARWTFIAVSNDMTDDAHAEANQRDRPRGLISDNKEHNITVWIKTWAEIINDARARLEFLNKTLNYQADMDTAKKYLFQTHEKFIPKHLTENQTCV